MMGRDLPTFSTNLDFFTQARKALSERSPFDTEEALVRVPTLPVSCSLSLSRYTDARSRKQKKAQQDLSAGASQPQVGPRNIWAETEDYFRPVTLSDVEFLSSKAKNESSVNPCFRIPALPSENVAKDAPRDVDEVVLEPEDVQEMEIDSVGPTELLPLKEEEKLECSSLSSIGIEWLLGAKHKVLLTSERPSKKRKLLGEDAGLERLFSVCDESQGGDADSSSNCAVCHVCSMPDTGHGLNCLLQCDSCKVAVHQKCYGVKEVTEEKWLCSWCKKNAGRVVERPCLLCPKGGGALKPVGWDSGGNENFLHLFCCQWMPEVYVENTETMEPVLNIEGIQDTRRKLLCSLCKVKYGVCIRCSHGTCRTSFHPICAREAKHRMEIWGKVGCDNVELRAFCSKHSTCQDSSAVHPDSALPRLLPVNGLHELKIEHEDKECVNMETHGAVRRDSSGDSHSSDSLNVPLVLKKLIDQGKVKISNVATEIDVSAESLVEALKGDLTFFPLEWRVRIIKWLRNSAHVATSVQSHDGLTNTINLRTERGGSVKDNNEATLCSSGAQENGCSGTFVSKNGICESHGLCDNDERTDGASDQATSVDQDSVSEGLECTGEMGRSAGELVLSSSLAESPNDEGNSIPPSLPVSINGQVDEPDDAVAYPLVNSGGEDININCGQPPPSFSIHPFISSRLLQRQYLFAEERRMIPDCNGQVEKATEAAFCTVSAFCNGSGCHHSGCDDTKDTNISKLGKQMTNAESMGIFDLSPGDEVEGEILYYQNKLLDQAMASKHHCDLIQRVVTNLPHELEALRKQRWDAVIVNQFLCEVREAKKQGRKERRHKEAQAVLAAATAAAAASSRISSFRKDVHDDVVTPPHESLLKTNSSSMRVGPYSQLTSQPKDSRMAVQKASPEFSVFEIDPKDHSRVCDICRRGETMLNHILVCCNCKVAVHMVCYHSLKDHVGPWYCEPCEEMLLHSRSPSAPPVNAHERSCSLCGGTSGAFRKSIDGQWIHALCAEWLLESTFRRGQPNPVEGTEVLLTGRDTCCICYQKFGACLKCSYGHCLSTFHPTCARNAGFYMNVKIGGGKFQHKAYCGKHSFEQREKAESRYGLEELRRIKQIRVELEKLRLLCERIIKREKLKKELVLCSHDILASKRDCVAWSFLVHSFFPRRDVSSESVTTSLKSRPEDSKSCNEAVQQSDDITVDSMVSRKRRVGFPQLDFDRKTEDSSTSQRAYTRRPMERISSSGKQLLHRPASVKTRHSGSDGEKMTKSRKHTETFQKEMVMTSDEASLQNQRLPKGFAYVPIGCLSKEKLEPDV
ncbi:uncharacterized protein [Aristolochia californica]|uniref:uncharacterized protein isoform X2 n=1 Tax=Aristolochia californica TaxID=171875 RepID=UPI0035E1F225